MRHNGQRLDHDRANKKGRQLDAVALENHFDVIPGWSEGPDPESRDSGFGPADRPGMTESYNQTLPNNSST
jgi:hypothetical protein